MRDIIMAMVYANVACFVRALIIPVKLRHSSYILTACATRVCRLYSNLSAQSCMGRHFDSSGRLRDGAYRRQLQLETA